MNLLLNTTIRITLIVLVALAASSMLRRRSAAVRHFVLAVALACAAATPALRLVVPAWQTGAAWLSASSVQLIDRPLAVLDDAALAPSGVAGAPVRGVDAVVIARLLRVVWMIGVGASLLVLLVGLGRLWLLASRATRIADGPWADAAADIAGRYGLRRAPIILQSDHPSLLVTWGLVRSKVLVPAHAAAWPDDRIRIVLGHELAHIRRGDWLVQMAAVILRSAYWFNPLVWIACRRLRLESEQACDDAVLEMGVEGSTYATELVDLARAVRAHRQMFLPAAAIARSSSLERRVTAMLNVRLNRDPLTRSASIAAAIVLAVVTVLVAGFGASAQSFSTVSGSLVDPLGRVLPGATLTLSNAQTQSKYEIKSDATGHYEFVGLPPGNYTLMIESTGFRLLKREGIALSGQPFEQNATLQVGSVTETITVADDGVQRAPQANSLRERPRTEPRKLNACVDSPVGGNIRPPTKIRDVRPIYPTGVKPAQVVLDARIGADGFVTRVETIGDVDPALANAAISAVSGWEFTPTYLDCQPIEVQMKVNMNFVVAK
jgi:beta-lactamase regulating signal transducer with metallopeptidase domain